MKKLVIIFLLSISFCYGKWNAMNRPIPHYLTSIIKLGDTLFLGSEQSGGNGYLWVSGDNGGTWKHRPFYFNNKKPIDFMVNRLHCIDSNVFLESIQARINVSNDSGKTFYSANELKNVDDPVLFFKDTVVFCLSQYYCHKSTNYGRTWSQLYPWRSNKLTFNTYHTFLENDTMFCGQMDGLYYSTNYGDSWSYLYKAADSYMYLKDVNEGSFYATSNSSLYHSSDYGKSWQEVKLIDSCNYYFSYINMKRIEGQLFVCLARHGVGIYDEKNGIFKLFKGLPSSANYNVEKVDGILYVMTDGAGLYASTDMGEIWIQKNNGLSTSDLTTNAITEFDGNLFAGTNFNVYTSEDNGASWFQKYNQTYDQTIAQVNSSFCFWQNDTFLLTGEGARIRIYNKDDKYWSSFAGIGHSNVINIVYINPYYYACTAGEGIFRIQKNSKYGCYWEMATTGLPLISGGWAPVYSVINAGDTIIAATAAGLYYSTNFGGKWQKYEIILSNRLKENKDKILDGDNLPTVKVFIHELGFYFAGTSAGIYKSSDAIHWMKCKGGLSNENINCFAIYQNTLFAGTSSGLYVSTDSGDYWGNAYRSNTQKGVVSIYIKGDSVLISDGENIFKNKIDELEVSVNDENNENSALFEIFPNPAEEVINLKYNKPDNPLELVKIYDIFGNLIYENVFTRRIDISKFSAGFYILRIGNKTVKFIKQNQLSINN